MALPPFLRRLTRSRPVGAIEYYLRPGLKKQFGGPFNGQQFRRQVFCELAEVLGFDGVIECGTYRGTTTPLLQQVSGVQVDTVEADGRLFGYCQTRFARVPRIKTHHDDSRSALRRLVTEPRLQGRRVFVYLDAHWREDLPLREELEILFQSDVRPVALIDDFRVPGDDGYGFDDYGPGKRLDSDYLDRIPSLELRRFFPQIESKQETGGRRGCVVVATGAEAAAIAEGCRTLREQVLATRHLRSSA